MTVLEARGISKRYGGLGSAVGRRLQVGAGEFVAVIVPTARQIDTPQRLTGLVTPKHGRSCSMAA